MHKLQINGLIVFIMYCLVPGPAPAQQIDLHLEVMSPARVGDLVDVDVVIAPGVGDEVSFFAVEIALTFDPDKLEMLGVTTVAPVPWAYAIDGADGERDARELWAQGVALFVGLVMPEHVPPPRGQTLFSFHFLVLEPAERTVVSLDHRVGRWRTEVSSIYAPGLLDVTGDLCSTSLTLAPPSTAPRKSPGDSRSISRSDRHPNRGRNPGQE